MRFAIGSRLREVRRAIDLASEFCRGHSLAERDANAIGVALDEVLSNVIHHGFGDAEEHEISVMLNYSNGEIGVEIEDDGPPFDPTQVPAPTLAPGLAQRKAGGLGLVFVRALTDSIAYRRAAERNCLVLRRRVSGNCPAAQPPPEFRMSAAPQGVGRVVTVDGRLDSNTAQSFRNQLVNLIRNGSGRLALDLSGVSYICSAGIWVLLTAENLAVSLGGGMAVFGLNPEIARLFERTGIADDLTVCNTSAQALATLEPAAQN